MSDRRLMLVDRKKTQTNKNKTKNSNNNNSKKPPENPMTI